MFLNRLIWIDPTIFHPGGNSHIKVTGVLNTPQGYQRGCG